MEHLSFSAFVVNFQWKWWRARIRTTSLFQRFTVHLDDGEHNSYFQNCICSPLSPLGPHTIPREDCKRAAFSVCLSFHQMIDSNATCILHFSNNTKSRPSDFVQIPAFRRPLITSTLDSRVHSHFYSHNFFYDVFVSGKSRFG